MVRKIAYPACSAVRVSIAAALEHGMAMYAGGSVIWRRSMSPCKQALIGPSYEFWRSIFHVASLVSTGDGTE